MKVEKMYKTEYLPFQQTLWLFTTSGFCDSRRTSSNWKRYREGQLNWLRGQSSCLMKDLNSWTWGPQTLKWTGMHLLSNMLSLRIRDAGMEWITVNHQPCTLHSTFYNCCRNSGLNTPLVWTYRIFLPFLVLIQASSTQNSSCSLCNATKL